MMEIFTELEIEAIGKFVGQARAATPEQREQVCNKLRTRIDTGECSPYKGVNMGRKVFREVLKQIESL